MSIIKFNSKNTDIEAIVHMDSEGIEDIVKAIDVASFGVISSQGRRPCSLMFDLQMKIMGQVVDYHCIKSTDHCGITIEAKNTIMILSKASTESVLLDYLKNAFVEARPTQGVI